MSDTPFVPNFGDDAPSGRKLCIICSKGNLDMAYPGLILANSALGEGIETHLFFTFWGLDIINRKTAANLKFSYLGNTAMHMPGSAFSMPQTLAAVPGMTAVTSMMMKKQIADLDVPAVPDFIELIHASGGNLWACKMSADMMKLTEEDLYPGVGGIISATDFMEISDGAQLLFI